MSDPDVTKTTFETNEAGWVKVTPPFGTYSAPPVTACWGARLIWPNDMLYDRQGAAGPDDQRAEVMDWLRTTVGDLRKRVCPDESHVPKDFHTGRYVTSSESVPFTVFEDEQGAIIGNPQGSYGYVYVTAFLHKHRIES